MTRLDRLGPSEAAMSPSPRYKHSIMARELIIDGNGCTWELLLESANRLDQHLILLYLLMAFFFSTFRNMGVRSFFQSGHHLRTGYLHLLCGTSIWHDGLLRSSI